MKKLRQLFILAMLAASLSGSAMAQTLIWDWSFNGTNYETTASGTFTTEDTTSTEDGFTGYRVIHATGTWNGEELSLATLGDNYNLLAAGQPQLNEMGITFNDNSLYLSYREGFYYSGGDTPSDGAGDFSAILRPVPEPSTLALAALGGLGGMYFLRRKKCSISKDDESKTAFRSIL